MNPIRFDYHKINTIKVIDWSHNFEIDSNGNLIEKYNFKGKMNKNPVCPINSITHTVPIHYSERPASFKIIVKSRSGDNLSGKGEFASLIELEKHITEEGGFGYFIDYGPESLLNIVANDSRIADYCEIEYEANNPLYEYFSKKDRYTYELKIPIVFCEEIKDSKLRMDINIPKEFSSSYNYNNNSTVIGSHIRFDLQTNGEPKEALELKLTYNVRNSFIYYIILNITITSLIVLMFILYKKKLNYNKSETYINKTQLKYMSPIFLTIVLGEVANLRASGSFVSLFFLVLDTLTLFSLIFSILLIIFVFIVERNKSES